MSIGREIILLSPDEAQVRNALIALSQVGEADDISEMESHAQETASTSAESKQVVKQAIEAIRKRSAEKR